MKPKILIIGSTGKLGTKLLKYTNRNSISVYAITCFKNIKKVKYQKKNFNIKKAFVLSQKEQQNEFLKLLESDFQIIYFLDYGSMSLQYLYYFLKFNKNSIIAVANKELIIAGGALLQAKIKKTNNTFIPLDSEHFSLINSGINKKKIKKIFITASGGPFYFNKKLNLNKVSRNKVLSHPKWKMGKNNLIDSSNFINKVLEIYELSYIYDIPISKIDFLISKEAFVHSIIHFNDNTLSLNCFINDMLITLVKPLSYFYKINSKLIDQNYLSLNNLKIEKPNDKRFKLLKYRKKLFNLSHSDQINLMIINNSAHKLYLSNKLQYTKIIDYIMTEILKNSTNVKLTNVKSILQYISLKNRYYNTNV